MTKSEVLLIVIGGIFVMEALSVAVQVLSFSLFRRRVLLMAPIHHHFELRGWSETKIIVRFWIMAAIASAIGFTLYQQSDRSVTAGQLARPSQAARTCRGAGALGRRRGARAAGRRPRRVIVACDYRRAAGGRRGGGEAPRSGRRSPPEHRWNAASRRREPSTTWSRAPGVPHEAPGRACAELGLDVLGELELGWRLLPNEFCAVTGTNGKTTTTELIGAIHRAAALPVEVAGNVGTPVSALAGMADPAA